METKHTPAQIALLKKLVEYGGAQRVWTGRENVWLCDFDPCTRVMNALIKKGLIWTHYPSGGGFANVDDEGLAAIANAEGR